MDNSGKGPLLIDLECLIRKYPTWKIAQQILEENHNVGALLLAVSTPERRQSILSQLNANKRTEVIQALSQLKRPPDFVLSTILDTLRKSLGPIPESQ